MLPEMYMFVLSMECSWYSLINVDLPSTFFGEANVTLSRLVRCANHVDFACDTYEYSSINDIAREHHGLA